MTKQELMNRVATRKAELDAEHNKLNDFKSKVTEFVDGIKAKSTIYALVKNLPIWKKLEELISE